MTKTAIQGGSFTENLQGGLISQATGSDFATGAAAAGANEALIGKLSQLTQADNNLDLMSAQLIGL